MKIKIIFLGIFVFPYVSYAQWHKVEEVKSPLVFSAHFDGNNIYVGTDTLYISKDKGLTWESKLIADNPIDITAFFQINEKLFAGTYGKGIYLSLDSGKSWHPHNPGIEGFGLYSKIFVLSRDTLFYGTDGGGIYFKNPGSSSWQSYNQNLPSNYAWTVNDMAVTRTNILASSGGSGYYYLRPKGSDEWEERAIITPQGTMTTPNAFLAIGDTVFAGSRYGIFRSTDSGYNWDSVGIRALPLNVVSLIKNNDRIYAGFTRSSGDFYLWYSDDFGDTWEFMDHQFQFLHKIYIYDNKIWAATNDGLWYNELEPTSVKPVESPSAYVLEQNYPNPFNPVTTIKIVIPKLSFVNLKVYDILGNEVASIINGEKDAGIHNIQFDASGLPSGIYFYQIQTVNHKEVKKMMLVK